MLDRVRKILKDKAPLILNAFKSGADEADFALLEKITETKLPEEFKTLYLNSDGFDNEHLQTCFTVFPILQ